MHGNVEVSVLEISGEHPIVACHDLWHYREVLELEEHIREEAVNQAAVQDKPEAARGLRDHIQGVQLRREGVRHNAELPPLHALSQFLVHKLVVLEGPRVVLKANHRWWAEEGQSEAVSEPRELLRRCADRAPVPQALAQRPQGGGGHRTEGVARADRSSLHIEGADRGFEIRAGLDRERGGREERGEEFGVGEGGP